jgi:hypothetical protein
MAGMLRRRLSGRQQLEAPAAGRLDGARVVDQQHAGAGRQSWSLSCGPRVSSRQASTHSNSPPIIRPTRVPETRVVAEV